MTRKQFKNFKQLKTKYPNTLLLMRRGDFYYAYIDDAKAVASACNIAVETEEMMGGNEIEVASFHYLALDMYLPKIIRSCNRVAICDQID